MVGKLESYLLAEAPTCHELNSESRAFVVVHYDRVRYNEIRRSDYVHKTGGAGNVSSEEHIRNNTAD